MVRRVVISKHLGDVITGHRARFSARPLVVDTHDLVRGSGFGFGFGFGFGVGFGFGFRLGLELGLGLGVGVKLGC